jgi:hypothetical protein
LVQATSVSASTAWQPDNRFDYFYRNLSPKKTVSVKMALDAIRRNLHSLGTIALRSLGNFHSSAPSFPNINFSQFQAEDLHGFGIN